MIDKEGELLLHQVETGEHHDSPTPKKPLEASLKARRASGSCETPTFRCLPLPRLAFQLQEPMEVLFLRTVGSRVCQSRIRSAPLTQWAWPDGNFRTNEGNPFALVLRSTTHLCSGSTPWGRIFPRTAGLVDCHSGIRSVPLTQCRTQSVGISKGNFETSQGDRPLDRGDLRLYRTWPLQGAFRNPTIPISRPSSLLQYGSDISFSNQSDSITGFI
jgi:hypothetical protein